MQLRQLRYIVEVHRRGNHISAAAEALHASQPGMSKQIQELEAELGFTIFERSRNRVVGLTDPGRKALEIAQRILNEMASGTRRKRVGLRPGGKLPAREGAPILDAAGARIGLITSGGFGPTVDAPVAMGYVEAGHAAPGVPIAVEVRGRSLPATVAAMPFVEHRYRRRGG